MASLLHSTRSRREAPHARARPIHKPVQAPNYAAPCTSLGTSPPEDTPCSPVDSLLASISRTSIDSNFSELSLGSSFDPPSHWPWLPSTTSVVRQPMPEDHASFLRKTLKKLKPGQQLPARKVRPLGRGGVGVVTLLELDIPADTAGKGDLSTSGAGAPSRNGAGSTLLLAHKAITCRRYDAARHARELAAMEAAAAGCPFILQVYGSSLPIGKPPYAIYTEYAPLGSLSELIESRRRRRRYGSADSSPLPYFDEHEIRWLAARVLAALAHLHSLGLVHRDVSPHNIYRSASGHPLLADFDAVSAVDEDGYVYGTAGRLSCAAPEVRAAAYGGGPYNGARADMWGLGAVLLEMVSEQELCQGPELEDCSAELRDLVLEGLLVPQARRLDAAAAQRHPFFAGVDWGHLEFEAAPEGLGAEGPGEAD